MPNSDPIVNQSQCRFMFAMGFIELPALLIWPIRMQVYLQLIKHNSAYIQIQEKCWYSPDPCPLQRVGVWRQD